MDCLVTEWLQSPPSMLCSHILDLHIRIPLHGIWHVREGVCTATLARNHLETSC